MQSLNENVALDLIIAGIKDFIVDGKLFKFGQAAKNSYENSKKRNSNKLTSSSIMSASKDLVMSFPVICSTSISVDTALMIQRAIERNCVTTLQMLFAAASLKGMNGIEIIKQWHNNMATDVSMDDYFDYIEAIGTGLNAATECAKDYIGLYGQRMIEECKRNEVYYPVSSFNESSLLSYELSYGRDGETDIKFVNEAKNNNTNYYSVIYYDSQTQKYVATAMTEDEFDQAVRNNIEVSKVVNYAFAQRKEALDRAKQEFDKQNAQDNLELSNKKLALNKLDSKTNLLQKQLLDTDIKKANELVPSMIIVRYTVVNPDDPKNMDNVDEFIAGVKARLIGVDSLEIIDRIRLVMENKVDLKNFLRATTGEIKFCKDFILAIDQAKIEAKRNSKLSKTSPIWRSLQNRATKSTYNRIKKNTNTAAAITSLVVSAEECNRLKMQYDIDLNSVPKCRQIMQAYNFMQVVIVDDAMEIAKFLLDNDDKSFQDYSYNALRKEMSDTEMKKLINIVSAANRG